MSTIATIAVMLALAGCFVGFCLRPHPSDPPQPQYARRQKNRIGVICGLIFLVMLAGGAWLSGGHHIPLP